MNKVQKFFKDRKEKKIQKQIERQEQNYLNKDVISKNQRRQAEIEQVTRDILDNRF